MWKCSNSWQCKTKCCITRFPARSNHYLQCRIFDRPKYESRNEILWNAMLKWRELHWWEALQERGMRYCRGGGEPYKPRFRHYFWIGKILEVWRIGTILAWTWCVGWEFTLARKTSDDSELFSWHGFPMCICYNYRLQFNFAGAFVAISFWVCKFIDET